MKIRLIKSVALTACLLWAVTASALSLIGGQEEEPLLEASEAFQTQVILDDANNLNVEINIAPGYFLYKSKLKVSSDEAEFGELIIPPGKKKQDQFFGEVETYRDRLSYSAPLIDTTATGTIEVKVTSQGCADIGICYPPYSDVHTVQLSKLVTSRLADKSLNTSQLNVQLNPQPNQQQDAFDSAGSASISGLGTLIGNNTNNGSSSAMASPVSGGTTLGEMLSIDSEDEVLDPEVAFTLDPTTLDNGVATIKWNIQDGHYLYKKRFAFAAVNNASIGDADIPEGIWEEDAFFGNSEVFRGNAEIKLPVTLTDNQSEGVIKVSYQGCADIGICYPPISKEIKLNTTTTPVVASLANNVSATTASTNSALAANGTAATAGAMASVAATKSTSAASNINNAQPPQAEQDRLADSLKGNNRWLTIATFFGMGLLLTFTPCVLPMVPILSSIIVGGGENISTRRAFTLSLVYVLAMALTYTIAGVLVGLSGENIQATLQHPYVLTAFAFLFVVLSFSMFGYYELQMPAFIQNRLSSVSNRQKGGSFTGVATMGFLSALIVGPCVTAPLVGALIYIGQTGDAVLGGAALFALSMGMGLPLLIIGTTFGKYMPKAGGWMDVTKSIFGVMLLGLAIYMLDRVIPGWATMLLSALLLITVAMFMGAFDSLPTEAPGWRRVSKGFGFAALVYGTLLMIGVATGTGTLLKPMQGLSLAGHQGGDAVEAHPTFETVKTIEDLNARLADARASNTPVMFDFYADWCISCKEMEAFTFTDPVVAAKMNKTLLLQADVTANDDADKALLKEFGIFGPPAIIFYDSEGAEIKSSRVVGFMPADKFSAVLDRVVTTL